MSHHIPTDFKTFVEYRLLEPNRGVERGHLQLPPSKFMSDYDESDYYHVLYEFLHSKIPCINIQHVTGGRKDNFFHIYLMKMVSPKVCLLIKKHHNYSKVKFMAQQSYLKMLILEMIMHKVSNSSPKG